MDATIISNYKAFLESRNYSGGTISGYTRAVKNLKDPPAEKSAEALIEYVDEALALKRDTLSESGVKNTRASLNALFFWLTGTEIKDARKQVYILDKESHLIHRYRDYCSHFLHLTPAVTDASIREVKLFLSYVSDVASDTDWSAVSADDVISFLSAERSGLRISSIGVTVTAVRRFFRFLQYLDIKIHASVLLLPLSTPAWSKNGTLPGILSESDYTKLENYEFPDTAIGNRDHAVLLCFIELGLRCSEVSGLMLSDIRWNRGSVVIRKTKTHRERELPLSKRLGEALEKYVMYYRPTNGAQLFFKAPRCGSAPVTVKTVRSIIRRIFAKTGINGWWVGTHTIRRSVGSRLYNAGNGLKSVSDLLGHSSVNTSRAYVRVDVNSLKTVADTWPGRE